MGRINSKGITMQKKMDSEKYYRIDHPLLHHLLLHDGKVCPAPANGHINGRSNGRQAVEGKLHLPRGRGFEELPSAWYDGIEIRGLTAHLPDGTSAPIYDRNTERPSDEEFRLQKVVEVGERYEAKRSEIINSLTTAMGTMKGPNAETILRNILHNLTLEWSQNDIRPQFAGFLYALLAMQLISEKLQGEMLHAFAQLCDIGIELRKYIRAERR
ncbi:hypothetical protein HU724_013475 [Pseudomonas iranensis]|nr:hypothetical protein [Pseudomonas iranensis]QXI25224.1 hypothetical protein HU724_013475 [Pseudomonas iranensis]